MRRNECDQFGVIETGSGSKITSFLEKPSADEVTGLVDNPDEVLASMGNYVFSRRRPGRAAPREP